MIKKLNKLTAMRKGVSKVLAGLPINSSTEIRLTRLCTQQCLQCNIPIGATSDSNISLENFMKITGKLRKYGAFILFLSGGEPTLHPNPVEILEEAKRTFPFAITLVTNLDGSEKNVFTWTEKAIDLGINIQTSIDGLDELGDKLRGGKGISKRILERMKYLNQYKVNSGSSSLLYANTVLNNINLTQIPDILEYVSKCQWKSTIGLYHNLTKTTRWDNSLALKKSSELIKIIKFLENDERILTLSSFINGIPGFVSDQIPKKCVYIETRIMGSRILIRENGDVYLCKGEAIGNLLVTELYDIFRGNLYRERLKEYVACSGCWTTCYTQRYLLLRPDSFNVFLKNMIQVLKLKKFQTKALRSTSH